MNVEELVAKAKELIGDNKIEEAKSFIEEHKDDLGEKAHALTALLGDNADDILGKVKGLFGGK
ncbi:hypothetical protein [Vagococcus intermedius]|uniref:Uncharacterized protein n=1 Tax=Vagococcus intermedius TaxID=2991418 RepID=A0AAF0CV40_9ENTE|nr:hypothetical protein [Vagococcus intermedius]WEG73463.1 hypothetical protein OL234_00720 [Vagococcus intermedius]WEG75546.1 hypothetical protein OL235_00730 [Vagococcus intermedius]